MVSLCGRGFESHQVHFFSPFSPTAGDEKGEFFSALEVRGHHLQSDQSVQSVFIKTTNTDDTDNADFLELRALIRSIRAICVQRINEHG